MIDIKKTISIMVLVAIWLFNTIVMVMIATIAATISAKKTIQVTTLTTEASLVTTIAIAVMNKCIRRIVTHFYLCTVQYKTQVLLHFFIFFCSCTILLYNIRYLFAPHILYVLFLDFFLSCLLFLSVFKFNRSIFLLWISYMSISTCVPWFVCVECTPQEVIVKWRSRQ